MSTRLSCTVRLARHGWGGFRNARYARVSLSDEARETAGEGHLAFALEEAGNESSWDAGWYWPRWFRSRGDYDALDRAIEHLRVERPLTHRVVKAVLLGRGERVSVRVPSSAGWVPVVAEGEEEAGEVEVVGDSGVVLNGWRLPLSSERFRPKSGRPIDVRDPLDRLLLEMVAAYMPRRIRVPGEVWEAFELRPVRQREAWRSVRKHGQPGAFAERDAYFVSRMVHEGLRIRELAADERLSEKTLYKMPNLWILEQLRPAIRDVRILTLRGQGRVAAGDRGRTRRL